MQSELPSADQSGIDGDGEAHSGIQKAIVVEEVRCPSPESIGIECPVLQRNREAKLGFFIALAMQGDEREILAAHESQQRARCGDKRRGLVEMTVKGAKDPIDFWNAQSRAKARASGVFHQAAGEMRLAQAAVQRQPISDAKLIFEEQGRQTSGHIFRVTKIAAEIRIGWIERQLIEIAPNRSHEAELVCRIGVVNQRPKSAEAVSLIVNNGGGWCFKAQTGAIEVDAAIVSQLPRVT